jgi:hypothetical protein
VLIHLSHCGGPLCEGRGGNGTWVPLAAESIPDATCPHCLSEAEEIAYQFLDYLRRSEARTAEVKRRDRRWELVLGPSPSLKGGRVKMRGLAMAIWCEALFQMKTRWRGGLQPWSRVSFARVVEEAAMVLPPDEFRAFLYAPRDPGGNRIG